MIKSIFVLEQVGQEIKSIPSFKSPSERKISFPTLTSSTGSPVKETLIVSPIPFAKIIPSPTEDFMVPLKLGPASVIPKCKG